MKSQKVGEFLEFLAMILNGMLMIAGE